MKIEKTYEKFSWNDFIMQWSIIFLISIIFQFLIYYFLLGKSISENLAVYFTQPIMFPILFSLGFNYINKNGLMIIFDMDNPQKIISGLTKEMDKRGFKEILIEQNHKVYIKKTMWDRFWNSIFRERLELIIDGEQIILKGKRNTFLQLEYKLKKI